MTSGTRRTLTTDDDRDEPDGYLDHFILIVAGKGQSSCNGLYKLGEKLNTNAASDAVLGLNQAERDCADRIWPHRFALSQNLDRGPQVGGRMNVRGGVDIGTGLWVLDYNMQSEYTDPSTFIHEFGHSLGLPDIYARSTNNSTASWEANVEHCLTRAAGTERLVAHGAGVAGAVRRTSARSRRPAQRVAVSQAYERLEW